MHRISKLVPLCSHTAQRGLLQLPHSDPKLGTSSTKLPFHHCTSYAFSFACCTSTLWELTAAGALVATAVSGAACPSSHAWTLALAFSAYAIFLFVSAGVFHNGFASRHLRHAHSLRMVAPLVTPMILNHCSASFAKRWRGRGGARWRARMHDMHGAHDMSRKSDQLLQQQLRKQQQQTVGVGAQRNHSGSVGGDTDVLATHRGGSASGSSSAPFASHAFPRVMYNEAAIWRRMGLSNSVHELKAGERLNRVSGAVSHGIACRHRQSSMHELHALRAKSPSPQPMTARSGAASEATRMAETAANWHQNGFCVARSQSRCALLR